jgi:hypothetical protein
VNATVPERLYASEPAAVAAAGARRAATLVVLVFLAVALGLFHETVFGGRQFFYRDLALQWHPQVEALVQAVGSGSWPLWNLYVSFGQPLLANPNNEVLYPLTWLNLLMTAWTFYAFYVVFHLVLAGVGTYALGRHLGLSRPAATVGGLLWVLSGPFLSLVNVWAHMAAAAWVPWIVRAGDRALERPGLRAGVVWGALFAMTVLCGSPEMGAMAAAISIVLALRYVPAWWRQPRQAAVAGACALLALAMALALSAGQWMPSLDVARSSVRAQMPAWAREYWSVHPMNLVQLALPVFADRLPLQDAWRARWYESREPYLLSLYVGLPAAALVLAGLVNARSRRWVWALAGLAAFAVLLALGRHAPVYEAMIALVPPLRSLRFPSKAMILVSFCAALIAGHGFDAWRERRGSDRSWSLSALALSLAAATALAGGVLAATRAEEWGSSLLTQELRSHTEVLAPVARSLFVCGALTAVAGAAAFLNRLRAPLRPPVLAWVVAVAALADLAVAQRDLNPTVPRGALAGTPPLLAVAAPAPHQRLFVFDYTRGGTSRRFLGHDRPFLTNVDPAQWQPWHSALALRNYAFPSLLALWRREGSYGADAVKLLSADVMTLNTLIELHDQSPAVTHRLLQLGAVDTVVALHRTGFEELTPVATLQSLLLEPIQVFRVPDPLPRAYVVSRARVAPVGHGWQALLAPDFDPAREVVLPEGPVLESGAANGSCRIVDLRPDRVEIDAQVDAPAYVVLVDAYDPGWQATIDGRPAPVLRANVAFRAVQVPAGTHRIRFVYRPWSVRVGLAISGLATALLLVLSLAGLRVGRGTSPA